MTIPRASGRPVNSSSRQFTGLLPEGSEELKHRLAMIVTQIRSRPDAYQTTTLAEALGVVVATHPDPEAAIRAAYRRSPREV